LVVWEQFRLDVLGAARDPVGGAGRRSNTAADHGGGEERRVGRDGGAANGQHDAMAEQRLQAYLEMRAAAERNRRQLLGERGESSVVHGMSDGQYEGYNFRRHHEAERRATDMGDDAEALEEDTEEARWDEELEDQLYTIAEKVRTCVCSGVVDGCESGYER
jgi:hypothetical protein